MIETRRVYDGGKGVDYRVLVDRIWPRGLSKEDVAADLWFKEAAPTSELRKWFGHDPGRWNEFKKRYFKELDTNPDDLDPIKARARKGLVVLLYSAKDKEHNQAVALKEYLEKRS